MFWNRQDAGLTLANVLAKLDLNEPVVLPLPRGGVPVVVKIAPVLKDGHSRVRDFLLESAAEGILADLQLPVFSSH